MYAPKLYWQSYPEIHQKLSVEEKEYLFDKGSLTQRLKLLSQNNFSLDVLSEKQRLLREDEYTYLNLYFSQKKWVREVVLKGYNQPWVYARSVIISHYEGQRDKQPLMNIGQQPLGAILFTKDHFKRSPLQVVRYPMEWLPRQYSDQNLWARRSCFTSDTQTVLVQEVFLQLFWNIVKIKKKIN